MFYKLNGLLSLSNHQYSELKKRLSELLTSQDFGQADSLLKAGLMDASKTNEMLVWIAMFALKQDRPKLAQATMACLSLRDPSHQPMQMLVKALAAEPRSAIEMAREAYRTAPLDSGTLPLYVQQLKQSSLPAHQAKLEEMFNWYISDFKQATDLIGKTDLISGFGYEQIAIIKRSCNKLTGWVMRPKIDSENAPPSLLIITNNTQTTRYTPKRRLTVLSEYDLWQFEVSFQGLDLNTLEIDLQFENDQQKKSKIFGSYHHPVPAAPDPNAERSAFVMQSSCHIIDIIIPVYAGLQTTLDCINSVMATRSKNQTDFNILVVNDASPDPELRSAIEDLANNHQIELLTNYSNQGFIGAVNRALNLHQDRDVVLLNSDTLVNDDWLDRMVSVAYDSQANHIAPVASVTPYTNNGELMSLLGPNIAAPALMLEQLVALDSAAKNANPVGQNWLTIDAPCGFCMFMGRDALEQIGYLDPTLKRGYGEESDWAYRAIVHGWHHVGATNVVVAHQGGVSFGDEKRLRVMQNLNIIEQRYPNSSERYREFKSMDPMRPSRNGLIRHWLYNNLKSAIPETCSQKVFVVDSMPLALQVLSTQSVVLLLNQNNIITLIGACPMEWRVEYHLLLGESLELEQDLAFIGVLKLETISHDLLPRVRYLLPKLPVILADPHTSFSSSARLPMASYPWQQHVLSNTSQEHLIAVVGEAQSFNTPEFVQLANQLSKVKSKITLLASEYTSFQSAAVWSSGHVYPCSFASSGHAARVELLQKHLQIDGVLFLDCSVKALLQAQLLESKSDNEAKQLPWVQLKKQPLYDSKIRDYVYIEQLTDLTK